MAGEVASAYVSLLPSAKGFGKSTQRQIGPQMDGVAKKTGSRFGKVFASATASPLRAIGAAAIGLFAVAKVKDFFQGAIAEARESQKVSAITAQVIKTTGGAANVSAGQVGKLAASISNLTGIDDEAIQAGSNLLLTFKNIRNEAGAGNDIFNQTTRIMTDMATAMGNEPKAAAIQLGKALNDPVKGITALSRVGVSFTEQQKKQIETLVESGNVLGAQKIILKELKSEFGGTAAAAATAGEKFKTTFANFQEAVGTAFLPYLDRAQLAGIKLILLLQNDLPRAFAAFRSAIEPAVEIVRSFVEDHLEAFKVALSALAGSALTSVITLIGGSLVSALAVLVGALASPIALVGAAAGAAIYAYIHFEGFRTSVNNLAASFQTKVVPALIQVGSYIRTDVVPALVRVAEVIRSDVLPVVRGFVTFMLTDFYPTMIKVWAAVAQRLAPIFSALADLYQARILPIQRQVLAQLREYAPIIGPIVSALTKFIAQAALLGATLAGTTLPPAIRLAGVTSGPVVAGLLAAMNASNRSGAAIAKFAREMVEAIGSAMKFAAGVVSAVGKAVNAVQEIPSKARAALGNLSSTLYAYGRDLIQGFIDGIRDKAGEIVGAVTGPIDSAIGGVKGLLKINSPSKVFHEIGGWTMEGFRRGIVDGGGAVTDATEKVAKGVRDKFEGMRDALKSTLDGLKSDFGSLRDSIASAFSGDLFSATNASDFLKGLTGNRMQAGALSRAFAKLKDWGIDPKFLSQLFQSGNAPLILDLASGPRSTVKFAQQEFAASQSLTNQLGTAVANNDLGPDIRGIRQELQAVNKKLASLPKHIGKELGGASSTGNRGRVVA